METNLIVSMNRQLDLCMHCLQNICKDRDVQIAAGMLFKMRKTANNVFLVMVTKSCSGWQEGSEILLFCALGCRSLSMKVLFNSATVSSMDWDTLPNSDLFLAICSFFVSYLHRVKELAFLMKLIN